MSTVDHYIRQAEMNGGLHDYWEAAWTDLSPTDLGKLTVALRKLGQRRRRVGRVRRGVELDGAPVEQRHEFVERFSLTRGETAKLVKRLIEAGVPDSTIRRYAGVPRSKVGAIRRQTLPSPASWDRSPSGISRNENQTPTDTSTGTPRTCACGCGRSLSVSTRSDRRYYDAACKQAAHRARRTCSNA